MLIFLTTQQPRPLLLDRGMNKKLTILTILVAIITITILFGVKYTGMASYSGEEPIVITTSSYPPGRFLYLPLALNFYKDEGLNIVFQEISDEDLVQALASGHSDLVHLTTDWFVIPAAEGLEAKELFYIDLKN